MKPVLIGVATLLAAFGAVTWWALESRGVAVIETRTADDSVRFTHVWYTEPNGELWLEAGTPGNGWFIDVQENPDVRFEANGQSAPYIARPVEELSGHDRIRSLIRAKYGFRDRWVGLVVDTSRSVAVRLLPTEE